MENFTLANLKKSYLSSPGHYIQAYNTYRKPSSILQATSVSKTPGKTPPTDNVTKRDLNILRAGKKKT